MKTASKNEPDDAFPGASCGNRSLSEIARQEYKQKRTFSMNPQEGTGSLPFDNDPGFKEPHRRSFLLSLSCDIVIRGRIGRREPGS